MKGGGSPLWARADAEEAVKELVSQIAVGVVGPYTNRGQRLLVASIRGAVLKGQKPGDATTTTVSLTHRGLQRCLIQCSILRGKTDE